MLKINTRRTAPAAGASARGEKKFRFFLAPFGLTSSISFLNVSNIRARTVLYPTNVLLIFALVEYKPYLQTKRTAKMKKIEKTAGGANFAAVTVGKMDELNQHTLILAPGVEIPGKVFTGSALGATGAEMSFQRIDRAQASGSSTPTRRTRNSTSSSGARESFRWTAKSSPSARAA